MRAITLGPPLATTLRFRLAASAALGWTAETIAQRRRQPVVVGKNTMSPSFLKHAEDQTVTALAAVLAAVDHAGWTEKPFDEWGVLVAGNFFGRAGIAKSVEQFRLEGPWGISPHLIPQQSLHAAAGTISQAFKMHGPNFGVSGGPNAAPDGFLLAASLLADGALPGLWLVLSGHDGEMIPTLEPTSISPTCLAVALALTADDGIDGAYLAIGTAEESALALTPEFQLSELTAEWQRIGALPAARWRIADTHWIAMAEGSPAWEEHA